MWTGCFAIPARRRTQDGYLTAAASQWQAQMGALGGTAALERATAKRGVARTGRLRAGGSPASPASPATCGPSALNVTPPRRPHPSVRTPPRSTGQRCTVPCSTEPRPAVRCSCPRRRPRSAEENGPTACEVGQSRGTQGARVRRVGLPSQALGARRVGSCTISVTRTRRGVTLRAPRKRARRAGGQRLALANINEPETESTAAAAARSDRRKGKVRPHRAAPSAA